MSKNAKLPVQVAFSFFRRLGTSYLSEFNLLKIKSSQKDYTATVEFSGDIKQDLNFWAGMGDEVTEISHLWKRELKIKLKISDSLKSGVLTIKAK
jgi:hypothetical protein